MTFVRSLVLHVATQMSAFRVAGRLAPRNSLRPTSFAVATPRQWRCYSPKGSQLPVVEEKRRRAMQGGGEGRVEKQHKSVSGTYMYMNKAFPH